MAMPTETSVEEQAPEVLAMSKSEAARMLGVSVRTVDRLIALKHLPVRRLGRRVVIPRNGLQNLLRGDHSTKAA
jgi:excisionase family DNA binding protein